MAISDYRDLEVWQIAMDFVVGCYRVTSSFPDHERFGLTSQLRRAAVSVPANIAEGHGRAATKAFLNHLSIASGSLKESETHLLIAVRLGYVSDDDIAASLDLSSRVGRMLTGLKRSLDPDRPR